MYLLLAIISMFFVNIFRIKRWKLFIQCYEKGDTRSLLQSLSIGNLLNFFVPYKLGDLVRALIAGRKMENRYGFSLATVIIDRCFDIVIVGILFAIFYIVNPSETIASTCIMYIGVALALCIAVALGWTFRKYVKKCVKCFSSLFNETLELKWMKFFWSLIWGFVNVIKKISKKKLLLYTFGMWGLYIISYYLFSQFLNSQCVMTINWTDIFYMLFAKSSITVGNITSISESLDFVYSQAVWTSLYLIIPSIMLLILSLCVPKENNVESDDYINLLPHQNEKERLDFLEMYFDSEHSSYIQNYLKINQDILIQRDYSAGSNATTLLCIDTKGGYFYRKYAMGADGDKLYKQIEWLNKYKTVIPLCEIIQFKKEPQYCFYDMVYSSDAVGMFEYAHSMPKEKAWAIIQKVIQRLEETLYQVNKRPADMETIHKYISGKVDKNVKKIQEAKWLKGLMEYEEIIINGIPYKNLPYYFKYLNQDFLSEVFKNDSYSAIHGDLTIENIICKRDAEDEENYYIIDPNTGNIHDSSNLDYAKLLQSIHGGYEFLMATKNVELIKNKINFTFTKSGAYNYLFQQFDEYLLNNFGWERSGSIYWHEVIHWLRLMPYKIEKNGKRVLLFYAGLLIVLNDVEQKFKR